MQQYKVKLIDLYNILEPWVFIDIAANKDKQLV